MIYIALQLYGGCSKVAKSKDARCGGGGVVVVFITDNNSTLGLHCGYLRKIQILPGVVVVVWWWFGNGVVVLSYGSTVVALK